MYIYIYIIYIYIVTDANRINKVFKKLEYSYPYTTSIAYHQYLVFLHINA